MEIDYKKHYDDAYFTGKKTYKDAQGNVHAYHGPALTWEGFHVVGSALASLLPKGTLLDIGCSGGDLARYLMKYGFDSYGIEISEYAVKNCVPEMRGKIALNDISECPETLLSYHTEKFPSGNFGLYVNTKSAFSSENPEWAFRFPDQFDTLIATDLLEHIYAEDLNKTFNWMLSKTRKWMFFCVATVIPPTKEFVAKKGEPIPLEYEATAVSGHVNVRTFTWWAKYFKAKGLKIRWDLMYLFQARREQDEGWRNTGGWNMQTTFFLEKV